MKKTCYILLLAAACAAAALWWFSTQTTPQEETPQPVYPDPSVLFPDSAELARRSKLKPEEQDLQDLGDFVLFALSEGLTCTSLREPIIKLDKNPMSKIRYFRIDEAYNRNYKCMGHWLYPSMKKLVHGKTIEEVKRIYQKDSLVYEDTDTLRYGMPLNYEKQVTPREVRFFVSHIHYSEITCCGWEIKDDEEILERVIYFIRDGNQRKAFWGFGWDEDRGLNPYYGNIVTKPIKQSSSKR